ncbi:hypothetical protein K491DRAFT_493727 [Lophiostoma macrostomum CBS 122681]|uniref:Uncharacterized protein n=1 Tax=Lophiostoma macrostomum CBS 122681 TaxID=1314788 RepID=A0A6A6T2U6_9PLEO|nr:hypothetical protein K491DRAFT_493727 [Lophiostoma macrostomum CBS 122681]
MQLYIAVYSSANHCGKLRKGFNACLLLPIKVHILILILIDTFVTLVERQREVMMQCHSPPHHPLPRFLSIRAPQCHDMHDSKARMACFQNHRQLLHLRLCTSIHIAVSLSYTRAIN